MASVAPRKSKRVSRQNSASGFDKLPVCGRDTASGGFDSQELCEGHLVTSLVGDAVGVAAVRFGHPPDQDAAQIVRPDDVYDAVDTAGSDGVCVCHWSPYLLVVMMQSCIG